MSTFQTSATTFTSATWEREVLESPLPVLTCFSASWCPHCKHMHPIVEQLADEMKGSAVVGFVDVDAQRALARQYRVQVFPTFIVFRSGKATERQSGEMSLDNLKKMIGTSPPWVLMSQLHPSFQQYTLSELRDKLTSGIDHILSTPIIARHMSDEDKHLMLCQKQLWLGDDLALGHLLALVNKQ